MGRGSSLGLLLWEWNLRLTDMSSWLIAASKARDSMTRTSVQSSSSRSSSSKKRRRSRQLCSSMDSSLHSVKAFCHCVSYWSRSRSSVSGAIDSFNSWSTFSFKTSGDLLVSSYFFGISSSILSFLSRRPDFRNSTQLWKDLLYCSRAASSVDSLSFVQSWLNIRFETDWPIVSSSDSIFSCLEPTAHSFSFIFSRLDGMHVLSFSNWSLIFIWDCVLNTLC